MRSYGMFRLALLVWAILCVYCLCRAEQQEPVEESQPNAIVAQCVTISDFINVDEEAANREAMKFYPVDLDHDLQAHIIRTCEDYEVDAAIVFALIDQETDFEAGEIGDGGESYGLCQVQPKWHGERMERLGCEDLLNPYQNVTVSVDYLAEQVDRYEGDVAKALTAYNQGHFKGVVSDYAKSVLATAAELRGDNHV